MWRLQSETDYRFTFPSLVYRYIVWLMVPSDDGQFCLYQHLVYVVKLTSKGYISFLHYPSWSSGPWCLANTDTDCSNAQPIMIAMSGTAAMGGHRRRLGGGSMMTRCDGCSHWRFLLAAPPSVARLPLHGRWFRFNFKRPIWLEINMPLWFVNECASAAVAVIANPYTFDDI
jgi:hypothetical protein